VTLELELLVPDGVVLKTHIRGLQAADASGRFGLLPGHETFVTILEPGLLMFRDEQELERYAAVDGGVLVLKGNLVSIACREAVVAERLEDVAERAAAMIEERRLAELTARADFAELQATLLRQLRKAEGSP
jgi:F-type H+-transporting ATPase subunit epsilon